LVSCLLVHPHFAFVMCWHREFETSRRLEPNASPEAAHAVA
jgi:hypothetical protein